MEIYVYLSWTVSLNSNSNELNRLACKMYPYKADFMVSNLFEKTKLIDCESFEMLV